MPVFTTACPRDCYSTCSMRVEVEDGRIRRIEPHPGNLATPAGLCLKGLSHLERVVSDERLLHPLRRTASGTFERVSWDTALGLIAEKLEELRSQPRSVMLVTGSGTKGLLNQVTSDFWRLYGGCTTTYGDLCWPAGLEATRLTLGDNIHSAPWDIANARLIVLWGKNPAETNIHQMRFIEDAVGSGAKVVVIDPRRTQSAENADLLVQVRPGTDGALALGVAHQLVTQGLVDREFVERHVLGYPELAEMIAEYPPRRVAALCGVPEWSIRELAHDIGTIKPATICGGFGMQRYTNSGQAVRAIIALLALTGNLGTPGAGWVYANLQSHVFSSPRDPIAFFPPAADDGVARISVSIARLGEDMLAQRHPALRMVWIERANPVSQNPHTSSVLRALRSLELRVVVDQFLTDTAREADLVLPAKTMFEQSDVINAYWHSYIQLKQKILEPPGEVKPETEIYHQLARRLDFPPEQTTGVIPEPTDEAVEAYLERCLAPFPELTLERLRQGPVLAPGHTEVAWRDLRFPTPSGRIELLSEEAAERWDVNPLPRFTPSEEAAHERPDEPTRFPLLLLTPNTKNRIHSQFNNLPSIQALDAVARVHISPEDADSRGVRAGDRVAVYNPRGRIELTAEIDAGLRLGCVSITNGWWRSQEGAVNELSAARETDIGHGAAFHDNLVEVEKLP